MFGQFILADRSRLCELLRGPRGGIEQENRHLMHTSTLIGNLVGLTWRMETFLVGSRQGIARSVCEELFIGDRCERLGKEHLDRVALTRPGLKAGPGDVIVILPKQPAFKREHFPDRFTCSVEELVPHLGNSSVRRLLCHMLKIEYSGCSTRIDLRPIGEALGVESWLISRLV